MPSESRSNENNGSGSAGNQPGENSGGSYSPEWLRRSRDDVPQTDKPPRRNPVVEAIMGNGNSTNEQSGQPQPTASKQAPAEPEE